MAHTQQPEAGAAIATTQTQQAEAGAVVATTQSTQTQQPEAGAATASNVPVKKEKKRKQMVGRSVVWKQFKKSQNEDGEWKGTCIYCQSEIACDSIVDGTSGMKNHMKSCKQVPHSSDPRQTEMNTYLNPDGSKDVGVWKFDQEACKKALALMIIEDELPFRFVEGAGFRRFMATVQNRFVVPSRTTISRCCYQMYVDEKLRLKGYLMSNSQRVSITTDTWTSIQRINYMVVTTHFIDNDWNLQKKNLNFCPINSNKGDAIGKTLEKCMVDWGITKVFTITVDNASSNDLAVAWIRKKMNQWGTSICEGEFLHVRCIAHIINLMVMHGLTTVGASVIRIREAVRYIRQSPARLSKFKECVEREKFDSKALLCLDVCTRWNSTYLMLETALKFEKAFEAYEDVDPFYKIELDMREEKRKNKRGKQSNEEADLGEILAFDDNEDAGVANDGVEYVMDMNLGGGGVPREADWVNARRLCHTLRYFYELTCFVSGSKYVIANAYFDQVTNVASMLRSWENGNEIELKRLAVKMHEKFDKYWGNVSKFNTLLYIAVVFDPRRKMDYVAFALLDVYGDIVGKELTDNVKRDMEKIYLGYWELHKKQSVVGETSLDKGGSSGSQMQADYVDIAAELISAREERYKRFRAAHGGGTFEMKSELESHLHENVIKGDKSFSILDWWKKHAPRFPILSRMAKDVLAVQVSTVASESAFSTGGRVLDPFRSSLTPMVVQALICAQDWFRSSRESMTVEEDLTELDKWEIEFSQMGVETTVTEILGD